MIWWCMMMTVEKQSFQFRSESASGKVEVEGEVKGPFRIPGQDDMKLKGVLALLHSVDQGNFKKVNEVELFHELMEQIEGTIDQMKRYDHFQGHRLESK